MHCAFSWRHDHDVFGRGHAHVELFAGDALDERMGGPGTLLELQLAPLNVEVVALGAQLLELDEELTRAEGAIDGARRR